MAVFLKGGTLGAAVGIAFILIAFVGRDSRSSEGKPGATDGAFIFKCLGEWGGGLGKAGISTGIVSDDI